MKKLFLIDVKKYFIIILIFDQLFSWRWHLLLFNYTERVFLKLIKMLMRETRNTGKILMTEFLLKIELEKVLMKTQGLRTSICRFRCPTMSVYVLFCPFRSNYIPTCPQIVYPLCPFMSKHIPWILEFSTLGKTQNLICHNLYLFLNIMNDFTILSFSLLSLKNVKTLHIFHRTSASFIYSDAVEFFIRYRQVSNVNIAQPYE